MEVPWLHSMTGPGFYPHPLRVSSRQQSTIASTRASVRIGDICQHLIDKNCQLHGAKGRFLTGEPSNVSATAGLVPIASAKLESPVSNSIAHALLCRTGTTGHGRM